MTSFSLLEKGMRQSRMNCEVKAWNQRSQYELMVFNIFRDREKDRDECVWNVYKNTHAQSSFLFSLQKPRNSDTSVSPTGTWFFNKRSQGSLADSRDEARKINKARLKYLVVPGMLRKLTGPWGKDTSLHLKALPWSKLGKATKYMRLIDYSL